MLCIKDYVCFHIVLYNLDLTLEMLQFYIIKLTVFSTDLFRLAFYNVYILL